MLDLSKDFCKRSTKTGEMEDNPAVELHEYKS